MYRVKRYIAYNTLIVLGILACVGFSIGPVYAGGGAGAFKGTGKYVDDMLDAARVKGDRWKSKNDALQQLEEMERAQKQYFQGKSNAIVDSIEKSKQRSNNSLKKHNWDLKNLDKD